MRCEIGQVSLAIVHYPVFDRNKKVVAASITNLDVHDISRLAKTYGLENVYFVTPFKRQREIVEKLTVHWREGYGKTYNPDRALALEMVKFSDSLQDLVVSIGNEKKIKPYLILTDAQYVENSKTYKEVRELIENRPGHYILVFGTGWGLTEEIHNLIDIRLNPIRFLSEYNHLSVRSAVAIITDRLLGMEE